MEIRQKLYEARAKRAQLVAAADELLKGETVTDENLEAWEAKKGEIESADKLVKALEKQVELAEQFGGAAEGEGQTGKAMGQPGVTTTKKLNETEKANKAFADAARKAFHVAKATGDQMQEGVDEDGGFAVPQDIVTRVIKYRETHESLLNEVTVQPVKTNEGRRTFLKRTAHTGFSTVKEAAKIPKTAGPKFEVLNYAIEKRSGYMPVTNELLADSDNNIAQIAVDWLGDESLATGNKEVLAAIKLNSETDLKNLDGIISAWIKLGSAFRATSKLITNDDGLAWLGTLKDQNGRYLLSPNPADTAQLQLCVGPHRIPVKTYDNAVLPNNVAKVPMIVGDLKQGIAYWDRQKLSVTSSTEATVGTINAFEQDMTIWKGSIRDDCTQWDKSAYINGYITPAGAAG